MTIVFHFHTLSFSLHSMTKINEKRLCTVGADSGFVLDGCFVAFLSPFHILRLGSVKICVIIRTLLVSSSAAADSQFSNFYSGGSGVYFM